MLHRYRWTNSRQFHSDTGRTRPQIVTLDGMCIVQSATDIYNATYLLVASDNATHLGNSGTLGGTHSSIYYGRAEDSSIEFNPTFNGQRANDIQLRTMMRPTIGTWQISDWTKPDNRHNDSLWLDHSVAT
eukprot:3164479-Amphidinium_carterae.2